MIKYKEIQGKGYMFDRNIKILIVDDMLVMRKMVINYLEMLGYNNVVEVGSGVKALTILQDQDSGEDKFDLVISDWSMPGLSGIELLKKIRANDKLKEIPFIMLTAESETKSLSEAVKEKVSNYITKPFSRKDFEAVLKYTYKKHFEE